MKYVFEHRYFKNGQSIHISYQMLRAVACSVLTCCGCLPVPCNANEVDDPMTQKAQCDVQLCVVCM